MAYNNQQNYGGNTEKKQSIGGLWTNVSKTNGTKYLNGKINIPGSNSVLDIIVFKNSFKKDGEDKSPDYKIYLRDKPNVQQQRSSPRAPAKQQQNDDADLI